jgi:hypothetical protein
MSAIQGDSHWPLKHSITQWRTRHGYIMVTDTKSRCIRDLPLVLIANLTQQAIINYIIIRHRYSVLLWRDTRQIGRETIIYINIGFIPPVRNRTAPLSCQRPQRRGQNDQVFELGPVSTSHRYPRREPVIPRQASQYVV